MNGSVSQRKHLLDQWRRLPHSLLLYPSLLLEEALPVTLQSELVAFSLLSDAELHTIATETMEEDSQIQLERLAEEQRVQSLTTAEQETLSCLMEEANRVMIRKAEAYRLLAQRGHAIFPAQESE